MTREAFMVLLRASWVITAGLCFYRAVRLWTDTPRFDWWFWGIALLLDLFVLGAAIEKAANR